MLAKSPDDPFLLYALAMECRKTDAAQALKLLERVIQLDPAQCYAYLQTGQIHESAGDAAAAVAAYRRGISAAEKFGDRHARDEISAALEAVQAAT
jgi:predicted TPR repeat methyltransferase